MLAEPCDARDISRVNCYVRVSPAEPGGQTLFGLYVPAEGGQYGAGWVFDFATKRRFLVATARCRWLKPAELTGGFRDLAVRVGDQFGIGVVIEEYLAEGRLNLKVRNSAWETVVVPLRAISVMVPES